MISISQLSRAFGTPVSTLRYYDAERVVPARGRIGAVRAYSFEDAVRLAYVQLLHDDGMLSLAETRQALDARTPGERRAVFGQAAERLRARITRLQTALGVIEHQTGCTAPDPQNCPVTGALLRLRAEQALARI